MPEHPSPQLAEATAAALAAVEHGWPGQITQLQALVREPSVLGHEAGVQRMLYGSMRDLGLEAH